MAAFRWGIVSKRRVTASGRTTGGLPFSRGALFHLLRNPIYVGQIHHKGVTHDGAHEAIVDKDLFDRVGQQLDRQARRHRAIPERRAAKAPLTGRLFDANGELMTPTFSRGRNGRLYRYYVSASLQQGSPAEQNDVVRRIAAPSIEKLVTGLVERWIPSARQPLDLLRSVHLASAGLFLDLPGNLASDIAARLSDEERILHSTREQVSIKVPLALPLRGGKRMVIAGAPRVARPDPVLIAALRKAHALVSRERGMPLVTTAPVSPYDRKLLRLAFLAPDLQRDILTGHQPASLNLERLGQLDIPLCWKRQRQVLGWGAPG